jgi:hypothetical protein
VANRWGDGPDTAAGVRDRVARAGDQTARDPLARIDDDTIATAVQGVGDLVNHWMAVLPGGKLVLSWPLVGGGFFGEATVQNA